MGGRPTVGPRFEVRLPPELMARLTREAHRTGLTRADIIRQALTLILPEETT